MKLRPNAASFVKDMAETVQRLFAAREQHQAQSAKAQQYGAQEKGKEDGSAQQSEVADAINEHNPKFLS